MNFTDTTTLAEIQFARSEQAPGWEAADDLQSARADHRRELEVAEMLAGNPDRGPIQLQQPTADDEIPATTAEDRRRLNSECDEATRDVLLKASVLADMADKGWSFEARHLDALREAVHRRDAAIAALRAAREHRSS